MIPLVVIAAATGKVAGYGLASYGTYTLGKQAYNYFYPNNQPAPVQTDTPDNQPNDETPYINPIVIERADSIQFDLNNCTTLINTQQIEKWITMGQTIELLKTTATESSEATRQLNELIAEWPVLSHRITADVKFMQKLNQFLQSRLTKTVNELQTTQINLATQEQTFRQTIDALQNQCNQLVCEIEAAQQHIQHLSLTHQSCQQLNISSSEERLELNNQIKTLSQTNEKLMTMLAQLMQQKNDPMLLASSPHSGTVNPSNESSLRFF